MSRPVASRLHSPTLVTIKGLLGWCVERIEPDFFMRLVPQFWQELKKSHKVREFVEDWNQKGYGLGLLTR